MPIYPYSFQLPPLNVQDIPNDGAPGEFLGINVGGALDWLPAGGGGSGDMLAANNLSELTNFATARTNIGLGTASTPTFANLTLTSPSLSSSAPVTISQTWNEVATVFTALKVNATSTNSAAASKLLDLQLGGVSKFSVDKSGIIALPQTGGDASALICGGTAVTNAAAYIGIYGIRLDSTSALQWSNGKNLNVLDTILVRGGAANLQLGAADAAAPVAQTLSVQSVVAGTTNTAGAAFTIDGSQGTGTGIGGDIVFRTAPAGSVSGSSVNPLSTAMIVSAAVGGGVGIGGQHFASERLTVTSRSNINVNCATFRNSSTTAKFQFYLNGAGNSELYLGANTLLSEVGNSYFNGGNVGIGTTAPLATLHVNGADVDQDTKRVALFQSNDTNINGNFSVVGITSADLVVNTFDHRLLDLDYAGAGAAATGTYIRMLRGGVERAGIGLASDEFVITTGATEKLRVSASGNVGIGTTSPTSKLHVAGNSSPSITVDNTIATGASQLLFKNTVVTGDTDGIFLNGSAQSGFGGAGSINIKATTGPIAFHTASVTNALSIAQNGITTLASGLAVGATHASSLADFIASGSLVLGSSVPQVILNSTTSAQESRFASGGNGFFFDVAGHATASNNDAIFRTGQTNASYNLTEVFRITYNGLITFGGLANTVPAIKRSTVRLQARLADDSAFTNIQGKLTTDTDYTAGSIVPTGFLTLYDAQGNAYKVPCVAA